nr:GtrA family protein [uncultured Holophaga sp.]
MSELPGLLALWQRSEKLRFLVVGAWNTLFGYGVFALAYALLGRHLHYLILAVLAHFIAVINAFAGHRHLTFRVAGHFWMDFLRFNLSYLGVLAFGLLALPALVEGLRLHPLGAQAGVIVLTTLGSYVLHKRLSFRRRPPSPL